MRGTVQVNICNAQKAQHKIVLNGRGPAVKTMASPVDFENLHLSSTHPWSEL